MPTLPPLFLGSEVTRVSFRKTDGIARPDRRLREPGHWLDGARNDYQTGYLPVVTQITEAQITGTFASTGNWTLTITPITTKQGAAAADDMGPASVTYTAAAETAAQVAAGLVAAVVSASQLLTGTSVAAWRRLRSYVSVAQKGGALDTLVITGVAPDQTFAVEITGPVAGDGFAETTVQSPPTATAKVGSYMAIDRTLGANGIEPSSGNVYLKQVEASTPVADLVGPVINGNGTEPVQPGYKFREYRGGRNVPLARYGHPLAYGEAAVPAADIGGPVYVRHTTSGDCFAGIAASATTAAVGATANVWTMTPVVVNDTLYQLQIVYGSETVVLTYLSDGTATDAEITAGMLAQLNLRNGAGQPLEGITGVDGATLVLTGPADGRSFTPASIGVGDMGEVETTAGVTTHILFERDTILLETLRAGGMPVDVPHSNA
jgi:hypothetical protein